MGLVKRCLSVWSIGAVGLALVGGVGLVRAAVPGYDYKSLFTVDQPLGDTGVTPTNGEIEVGGVNKAGTAVGVVNWGDGEGAFLVTADGKGLVLSKADLDNPAGGKFAAGLN